MDLTEISVEALREAIQASKKKGTFCQYLVTSTDMLREGLLGTPLHAACFDRNGKRGEAKIALLFEAANEEGLALHCLANTRTIDTNPEVGGDGSDDTPLHILSWNRFATQQSIEMVCHAWPDALFTEGCCIYRETPFMVTAISVGYFPGSSTKFETMLQCARDTLQDTDALIMHRDDDGLTVLHHSLYFSCQWPKDIVIVEQLLRPFIVEQLLRACPAVSYAIDFAGMNFLHFRCRYKSCIYDNNVVLSMVTCMVECLSNDAVVAVLSTECEGLKGPDTASMSEGVNSYHETPLCIIRRNGFVEAENVLIQLARVQGNTDLNRWTLLHYAAANLLCDGDPDEKSKRRTEGDIRVSANNSCFEEFGERPFHLPPKGERQGTKKLIDWLLEVSPQAFTMEDSSHRLPLQLAIETGKVWGNGVASLVSGYPEALSRLDPSSGLYPVLSAAAHPKADITTVFELLRSDPTIVAVSHTDTGTEN